MPLLGIDGKDCRGHPQSLSAALQRLADLAPGDGHRARSEWLWRVVTRSGMGIGDRHHSEHDATNASTYAARFRLTNRSRLELILLVLEWFSSDECKKCRRFDGVLMG